MKRIALVTANGVGPLDEDMAPLLEALGGAGRPVVWDDPAVDWGAFDLCVVRSTWDYPARRDAFLAWAGRVPRLLNPEPVLRWNTDKHYLREFRDLAVPTHFIEPGDPIEVPFAGPVVVKPTIGAGSMDAARHDGPSARDHVRRLQAAGRSVMVQPYLAEIDARGETALVFLGGRFSHAIRKGAMLGEGKRTLGGLFIEEEIRTREPEAAERRLAEEVVRRAPANLAYARVDLAPGPLLLEFEACEPSLFFKYDEGSARRFADLLTLR